MREYRIEIKPATDPESCDLKFTVIKRGWPYSYSQSFTAPFVPGLEWVKNWIADDCAANPL